MKFALFKAIIFLQLWITGTVGGVYVDMGLPDDDLYQDGDLILAGLFSLNQDKHGFLCGGGISYISVQGAQSMIYKIDQINQDQNLLPNITLGHVLLNDCSNGMTAIARVTQLIPVNHCWNFNCHDASSTMMTMQENYSQESLRQYRVIGLVGPYSSSASTVVSPLLSFYKIPHISWLATSDDLLIQANTKYPYFTRVVPVDSFQARALVDVISHFNWTYISVIYSAGSYGSNGLRAVSQEARKKGICLATEEAVDDDFDKADYDRVVSHLVHNEKARVVVLFVYSKHGTKIFHAIERANIIGKFIFFTSEGFNAGLVRGMPQHSVNLLHLTIPGGPFVDIPWGDKGFVEYYYTLNPWNNATGSKWYGQYVPEKVGCSFDVEESDPDWCGQYTNLSHFDSFKFTNWPARVIDTVEIFARALNATINEKCPEAFRDKTLLDGCIDGVTLNEKIRAVNFVGKSVVVRFDENGELLTSKYMLMAHDYRNKSNYIYQGVGMWDNEKRDVDFFKDKVIPWYEFANGSLIELREPPESVCAKPCLLGEFLLQGDSDCCWECFKCMVDEIVSGEGTECITCNETTWPDDKFTTCLPIPPRYIKWTDDISIALLSLTFAAFLTTGSMAVLFIVKRSMKIIKGSNRELMAPIFVGILLGYLLVLSYIMRPSNSICYVNFMGFHLSCSLIYVPLFLKTLRVYQIFKAAEKLKTAVPFANLKILIGCLFFIILVQVAISVILGVIFPPKAILTMPVKRVKMVELSCISDSMLTLIVPLAFNLVFVLMTAILGFLTRKLPDNFNESWHIFIAVITTLIVWMAFLPTYFITFYEYFRAALLAISLIINGIVITFCLFGPKVYAVFFVPENLISSSNFDKETSGTGSRWQSTYTNGSTISRSPCPNNDETKF